MDAIVYDKVGKEAEKVREALYGIYPQETITDAAIASFDDGADGIPVKALTVGVEPVQDLHGYDSPWPAGGGKNKVNYSVAFPIVSNGITISQNDDGSISINGTATANVNQILMAEVAIDNGAWTISGVPTNSAGGDLSIWARNTIGGTEYARTYNGLPETLNISTGSVYIYCTISSGTTVDNVKVYLQLESGSTATSYAPYSNECPISGHTGAEIEQRGKNLLPSTYSAYDTTTSPVYGFIPAIMPENVDAIMSFTDKDNSVDINGIYFGFAHNYHGGTPETFKWCINNGNVYADLSNKSSSGSGPVGTLCEGIIIFPKTEEAFNKIFSRYNVQVELGSTASSYEPYTGNQISVTFPSEAGIVYGATMALNPDRTGTLVVDLAMVDLGTLVYSKSSLIQNGFVAISSMPDDFPIAPNSAAVPNWICSNYGNIVSNNAIESASVDYALAWRVSGNSKGVIVKDSNYTEYYTNNDMESFKAAMSGVQLIYEPTAPTTIPLTAEQVSGILTTLYGTNNIWANTGNIEKLTYRADLGKYIDSHITTAVANALNA